MFFFFFQAEDGIRDYKVTGVQTCALPISARAPDRGPPGTSARRSGGRSGRDRKSTRLNSSHLVISYAVFCLKKKRRLPSARPWPSPSVVPSEGHAHPGAHFSAR